MGIQSAMFSGVSGLNTNSQAMSVIGNNLSNTNTLGYKGSRTVFSDLLSSNVFGSGGSSQVGRGVGLSTVDNIFSQGTFETTSSGTDVAVEGDGFFVLKEEGVSTSYYSRAGAFRFNNQGYLVNPEGLIVQGKQFDTVNNNELLPSDPSDIQVANVGLIPANSTSELTFNTNLNENSTEMAYGDKVATSDFAPSNAPMTTLTINGTSVGGTATTSTGKLAEINALSGTTGVTATQKGNYKVSDTAVSTLSALTHGDISINGISIGAVSAGANAASQAQNVADAINSMTTNTGVTATIGDGTNGTVLNAIILSNTTGAEISVSLSGLASAANTGLEAGTVAEGENGIISLHTDMSNSSITLGGNAESIGMTTGDVPVEINTGIDPTDKNSYNYSASSEIFDSLGESHLLTVYWRLIDDSTNTWNMGYTVDGDNTTPIACVADPNQSPTAPLDLTFDEDGNLLDTTGDGVIDPVTVTITLPTWTNGAQTPQIMDLSFDCTQYDSDSIVIGQKQNGYGAGELTNVAINSDGIVVASYSNGKQVNISQLVLAKFQNTGGLKLAGSNRYIASTEVGTIRVGLPGPELGKVFTNSLEQSNVDMGQEFVKMITTQRGFSANSKIITTVDEMLSELINLKR
ncbi:MAG: flagellar hook-basal body complex protein [Desulfobulbus sp.]|nr:flagellar hook-basal body complex protein [Desulfobulbus sp.]